MAWNVNLYSETTCTNDQFCEVPPVVALDRFHCILIINVICMVFLYRRGPVVEARFPIEHRKRSSKAAGLAASLLLAAFQTKHWRPSQCLGVWPPLTPGWPAGPGTLKGAGARKICRGANVHHVSIISLALPSQVTTSHLEVGSKLIDPTCEQKSGFHPLGIA